MKTANFTIILFLSLNTWAGDGAWLDANKNTLPTTEYRKTINGFGAWLLVTPDMYLRENWGAPSETVPYFEEIDSLGVGQPFAIFTFFVNPKTDEKGRALVECSLKVIRPNGSVSSANAGIPCMRRVLKGSPNYIRFSPLSIQGSKNPDSPLGKWVVEASVSDILRKTVVNLKTTFTLEAK